MKSAVETLNPTRVKLSVEVPFDDLKPNVDAAYRRIAQQISVPGFRRGRVPAAIIDQRVGRETILIEAVNEALPAIYEQAVLDNELTPLSSPELDVEPVQDGSDVTFTAELDIVPPITLPDFHGLEAEVEALAVTDEDIDAQVETLRTRFGTLTLVERAVAEGDFVTIDLTAAKDGEPIEEADAADMSYQVGSGTMIEGLDETLEGMSAGDERTFSSELVAGDFKGQQVEVTVKVRDVKEQELPDLDDEFAQMASEFDTAEELRADIRENVLRSARLEQAAAARDAVLERLLELVEVPLPDAAVAEEIQARKDSVQRQLQQLGMSMEDYLESEEQTAEEFEADLDTRVRAAMTAQFVLQEIAKVEQMGVEEGELTQQLLRRAQQSGISPEQYVQHAMEHNHLPEIVAEVRRAKALAHIVETAKVKDTAGEDVELATLLPDGTYADPAEVAAQQEAAAAAAAPAKDAASDLVIAGDYVSLDQPSS